MRVLRVVAGLLQRGGALLVCQRRPDAAFPLLWEFPGGKVRPGETDEAALRRELREELGIAARIGPLLYHTRHAYPGLYEVDLRFFAVLSFCGEPRNLAFAQIRWLPPAALAALPFLAADAELIALLQEGRLSLPPQA
ncbi:MAG: DNA mismatch repair protein MutT [Candidatus Tectimicrobiota bacterium]|nr:MAG: DNA mismatch repair protein MutT [Candidatus Tectomicrobia bacterium]